jgi:hypothetical protein
MLIQQGFIKNPPFRGDLKNPYFQGLSGVLREVKFGVPKIQNIIP